MSKSSFFRGIEQLDLADGYVSSKAPCFFPKFNLMSAIFVAKLSEIKNLLPDNSYRPVRIAPGKGLISLSCIEYKKSDIGPYNEVSLSIPVTYGGLPIPPAANLVSSALYDNYHAHVVSLPVSTEVAVEGGVEHFNYPKYLADISFRETSTHRICTVRDKETLELIVEMDCRKVRTTKYKQHKDPMRLKTMSINAYQLMKGHVMQAKMQVNTKERGISFIPNQASMRIGNHESAEVFKDLKPTLQMQYLYAPKCEGIQFLPTMI